MRTITVYSCLAALLLATVVPRVGSLPAQAEDGKVQVLVVGTYHMSGGRDYANPEVDNVLSETRQAEIEDFVRRLKKFQPTRIAVEVTLPNREFINRLYRTFLAGGYPALEKALEDPSDVAGEVFQVAFRLAKSLEHEEVFPIDHQEPFDLESVLAFAKANGQEDVVSRIQALIQEAVGEINQVIRTRTVTDTYRYLNSPEALRKHDALYTALAGIGAGAEYPGAELSTNFYKRNLIIFSNLTRIVDSPGERVLILIGQGHAPYLQKFVADHPDFELVPLADILR